MIPMDDATSTIRAGNSAETAAVSAASEVAGGPAKNILQRMRSLPDAVFAYLISDELADVHKKIFDEHAIAEADRDIIYYAELQTFVGEIALNDFPDVAWSRLAWDQTQEEKAGDVITDILGFVFLPAQAHLGDVAGLIEEFGGDLEKYPEKQLEIRRVTFMQGAKEIADSVAGISDDQRKRLRFIIESRLRDVRVDADTKEMLMRAKKTGGMELSAEQADEIIALVGAKMRMTKYVEAIEERAVGPAAVPPSEKEAHQFSAEEIKKIYAGAPEEQAEIAKRVARFSKVTDGDPEKMRDAYFQVLHPLDGRATDPLYVVAGLIGMADGDRISEAAQGDDRYRAIVREYLSDKNLKDELAAYEEDPTAPHFMNIFFQFVLRGIGDFSEADSARFGLRIINTLKKQGYDRYADLVAFDMEHGEFRWRDPIEP
jgi:hypothetical protein